MRCFIWVAALFNTSGAASLPLRYVMNDLCVTTHPQGQLETAERRSRHGAHDLSNFGGIAVWFGLYFENAAFTVL